MAIFNRKARHKRDKEDDPAPNPFEDDKEEVEQKPAFSDKEREGMRSLSTRDIAEQLGVEYVPKLDDYSPDPDALRFANADLCRKYTAIPVKFSNTDNTVTLAMADPRNVIAIDDFSHISGMRIAAIAAEADDINSLINRSWRVDQTIEELSDEIADVAAEQESDKDESMFVEDQTSPIIRLVGTIIDQAINDRASDIHVEPREKDMVIRYRIDGVLKEMLHEPKSMIPLIISRIKVMASMDIGEKRKPQDGRIRVIHSGKPVDLRVASLPTVYGEKVTMRILDAPVGTLTLEDMGMLPDNLTAFKKGFMRPFGMVLVTGPTGSGKSTTLYTTLNAVSTPEVNVITVEDPVEYRIDGINQVQVNAKAGMTFAAALRSILRSDPDIVLIGEIRDKETAQIAIEAALTGHLVLSTLHTNDAPSTATRLIEMGIEPFLVGQALSCVVAQRLVRRLCKSCKREYTPGEEELHAIGLTSDDIKDAGPLYKPVGCKECSGTGYRGRMAIHEIMLMNGRLERLIANNATTDEIAKVAVANGMTRLREDCWEKVKMGDTSISEVIRVTTVD